MRWAIALWALLFRLRAGAARACAFAQAPSSTVPVLVAVAATAVMTTLSASRWGCNVVAILGAFALTHNLCSLHPAWASLCYE